MPTKAATKAFEKWNADFAKTHDRPMVAAKEKAPYKVISTGSLAIDYASGVGGWVEGRLVEIWGVDSIGKTTLSLLSIASAQRAYPDLYCAFIDMEQTFDPSLAVGCGVDMDRLHIFTPQSAEQVADVVKDILRSGFFKVVVLDSIGAMIPEAEKEKDADQTVMMAQAKIITRMVKIAAVEAAKTSSILLMINQVRADTNKYSSGIMTGGGFALKHVTTHKIQVSRSGGKDGVYKIKVAGDTDERVVGYQLAVRFERNKVAPPERRAVLNLFNQSSDTYGPRGIDQADEAITLGLKPSVGAIIQDKAWYTITSSGERFNGRAKLLAALRKDPAEVAHIRDLAVASLAGEVLVAAEDPADEVDLDEDGETTEPAPVTMPNFRRGAPAPVDPDDPQGGGA